MYMYIFFLCRFVERLFLRKSNIRLAYYEGISDPKVKAAKIMFHYLYFCLLLIAQGIIVDLYAGLETIEFWAK